MSKEKLLEFVKLQLILISDEERCTIEKERGIDRIDNLIFVQSKTGPNGQQLLVFSASRRFEKKLSKGDIVKVFEWSSMRSRRYLGGEALVKSIAWAINERSLILANFDKFEKVTLDFNKSYYLIKQDNHNTFKLIEEALEYLLENSFPLRDMFFAIPTQTFHLEDKLEIKDLRLHNKNLNKIQENIVRIAIAQPKLAIIQGPPGTGKSTVLLEIIQQILIGNNSHILVTAPSNVAVDNLLERFSALNLSGISYVRLGNEARMNEIGSKYSISHLMEKYKLLETIAELTKLKGEELIEQQLKRKIISESNVIFTTLSSVEEVKKNFSEGDLDLIIIDEATQAIEPVCWLCMPLANKCIMAGDTNQLPPTVISQEAAKNGLEVSLMERLCKLYPQNVMKLLIQYRMHNKIMQFSSNEFYGGKLIADKSVESHLLCDLRGVVNTQFTSSSLLVVDTANFGFYEVNSPQGSKSNPNEANIVSKCVDRLIRSGVSDKQIGIITFYAGQVDRIRQNLTNVEVNSVDGFQGRENEVIILSFVRSNSKNEVGFLSDFRRINVALTRARRLMIIIFDSTTFSSQRSPFLRNLTNYVTKNADDYINPDIFYGK